MLIGNLKGTNDEDNEVLKVTQIPLFDKFASIRGVQMEFRMKNNPE